MAETRDTSLEAYIRQQPRFLSQELKVYACIKNNPNIYDREIAKKLSIEASTVAARRNTLVTNGLIVPGQKVKSITGMTVQGWIVN